MYGNYWAEAGEEWIEEEAIPEWRGGGEGDSKIGDQLSGTQWRQLKELLAEFSDVMSSNPERKTVI